MSHVLDQAVVTAIDIITGYMNERRLTMTQAVAEAKRNLPSTMQSAVAEAERELKHRLQSVRHVKAQDSIINPATDADWYPGPSDKGEWARYRAIWLESGKPGLETLDASTTRITALLANPRALDTPGCTPKRKGLVMGNVQSGKTGNYAGVIAKAADAGYGLVIVLAGLYNNLRKQTQDRLDHDVFHKDWDPLTDIEDIPVVSRPEYRVRAGRRTYAVVKKNSRRLTNLLDALRGLPEETRKRIPVLIIDDEADQATPNNPTNKQEISAINGLLRQIWAEVRVGTYLAYTATPFANVLMDADSEDELFPSDFITVLEPGADYFGAERVFGIAETFTDDITTYSDGLDMVREIPSIDVAQLHPSRSAEDRENDPVPVVPSLVDAMRWFFLATTVRRIRGSRDHSSMLIHTTHYAAPHFRMRESILAWLDDERVSLNLQAYRTLWEQERDRAREARTEQMPTWQQIETTLPDVLASVRVIVDNGSSDERLDYDKEKGQTVIAVGGGTLSRGLTLEGLVVSYFTRTSSQYDTLMQMGRWFGYRPGYEDLPRIWVAPGLDKDYAFLARVERDLRDEIASLEGSEFTPAQVGVKIRQHPGRLEITSVGRRINAIEVNTSLSGTVRQSFILDGSDACVTQVNRAVVEELMGDQAVMLSSGRWGKSEIGSSAVVDFLRRFRVHPDQRSLADETQLTAVAEWLRRFGRKCSWTVVIAENNDPDARQRLGTMTIAGREFSMVSRTPLIGSTRDRLDFKAVMSPSDWVADIPRELLGDKIPDTPRDRRIARRRHAFGRGIIVIYPISDRSAPRVATPGTSSRRIAMPTNHPVLAFGIVFPYIDDPQGREGTFVSVRPVSVAGDSTYVEDALPVDEE